MPYIITLLLMLSAVDCPASPSHATSQGIKEKGLPIHGQFCGPKIPTLKTASKEDKLSELNRIPPIDLIDNACKHHDICYELNGYFNAECDIQLIDDIGDLLESKTSDMPCIALSIAILHYFKMANPSSSTVGEYADSVIAALAVQGSNIALNTATSVGFSVQKATLSAYLIAISPIALLFGENPLDVTDAIKEVYKKDTEVNLYPDRFTKCTFVHK